MLVNKICSLSFLVILAAVVGCGRAEPIDSHYELVIQRGRVMDPETQMDAVRYVGIRDGQIAEISERPIAGARTIDASGLVVAPGFIDLHAHGQNDESFSLMVRDGVTTAFELELGTNDVAAWYQERNGGQLLNYGVSVGHTPIRMQVMGDQGDFVPVGPGSTEPATDEQVELMATLIEQGLEEGAVAVGFGLVYTQAASAREFEAMLRIVAKHNTTAHIHVREGLSGLEEAIKSAATTAAALHVVHANSSGGPDTAEFLRMIEEARRRGQDVTTEAYPYEAGMTRIESARFDDWESWDDEYIAMHQWAETGEFLNRETFGRYRKIGGSVIRHTRTEEMTRIAIVSPLTMIASDGSISQGKGHPRTAGTYAKVLGHYVRDEEVLTLMEALGKMTLEPARRLEVYVDAMRNKGRLSVGADADVTVFDPIRVTDRATYLRPGVPSDGIEYVIVNGVPVIWHGELVPDTRPGRAIRVQ